MKQPGIKVTAAPGGALRFAPNALKATTGLAKFDVSVAAAGHTFSLEDSSTLFESLSLNAAGTTDKGVAFFAKPGNYIVLLRHPRPRGRGNEGHDHGHRAPDDVGGRAHRIGQSRNRRGLGSSRLGHAHVQRVAHGFHRPRQRADAFAVGVDLHRDRRVERFEVHDLARYVVTLGWPT